MPFVFLDYRCLLQAWIHEEKTADLMGGIGVQLLALLGGSMFAALCVSR